MRTHYVFASLLLSSAITPSIGVAADVGFYVGIEAGQSRSELDAANLVVVQGTLVDSERDRSDEAFGLYGGYAFAKHFAIELAYTDLGQTSYTTVRDIAPFPGFPVPGFVDLPAASIAIDSSFGLPFAGVAIASFMERQQTILDSQSLALSLVGNYDLGHNFSLIGRAGIAVQRIESELRFWFNEQPIRVIGGEQKSSSGTGVLGLGAEWSFHPKWNVRLQVQRHFALEDEQIDLVELGDVTLFTGGITYRF